MNKVRRASITTLPEVIRKVNEICDASQVQTEDIADAYTVTVPDGFVPVRVLDLTADSPAVASVLATLLMDMQQRGAGRRTSSV